MYIKFHNTDNGTYVNDRVRDLWLKKEKHTPSKGFSHRYNVDFASKYAASKNYECLTCNQKYSRHQEHLQTFKMGEVSNLNKVKR